MKTVEYEVKVENEWVTLPELTVRRFFKESVESYPSFKEWIREAKTTGIIREKENNYA